MIFKRRQTGRDECGKLVFFSLLARQRGRVKESGQQVISLLRNDARVLRESRSVEHMARCFASSSCQKCVKGSPLFVP